MFHRVFSRCLALVLLTFLGCNQSDPIVTYTVPTKVPEQLLPGKDRMLAAIVPQDSQAWFFKVTGPEDAIDSFEESFRSFVQNIQFDAGDPDLNELPDGWRRAGEKPFRYASIDVNVKSGEVSKQLDVSISQLTKQDDWDQFVAMNVNRWRGQLGLETSDEKWAGGDAFQVDSAAGESVWFDMVGDPTKATKSMTPPFAHGGAMTAPMAGAPTTGGASANGNATGSAATQPPAKPPEPKSKVTFDTPDGWRPGKKNMFSLAALQAGPEDDQVVVTVTPAGGDLRANIARWIGQLREGSAPEDVVDKAMADAEKIKVADRDAQRFVLTGENADEGDAIDATIVPLSGGQSMFIKMSGPAKTVADENKAMAQFLESLKF